MMPAATSSGFHPRRRFSSRSTGTRPCCTNSVTGVGRRIGSAETCPGDSVQNPIAKEELVAEMTAAFTCAALGIVPTVRHADYIGEWLKVLREDNRAIVRAASAASRASDYLLTFRPDTETRSTVEVTMAKDA